MIGTNIERAETIQREQPHLHTYIYISTIRIILLISYLFHHQFDPVCLTGATFIPSSPNRKKLFLTQRPLLRLLLQAVDSSMAWLFVAKSTLRLPSLTPNWNRVSKFDSATHSIPKLIFDENVICFRQTHRSSFFISITSHPSVVHLQAGKENSIDWARL